MAGRPPRRPRPDPGANTSLAPRAAAHPSAARGHRLGRDGARAPRGGRDPAGGRRRGLLGRPGSGCPDRGPERAAPAGPGSPAAALHRGLRLPADPDLRRPDAERRLRHRAELDRVDSFWWALLAALVASAISVALHVVAGTNDDDVYTLRVIQRIARRTGAPEAQRGSRDRLPRDRRARTPGAAAGHAGWERARDGVLARERQPPPRDRGRPTSPRRPARARQASCSARTPTSPRSAGSRRRAAA